MPKHYKVRGNGDGLAAGLFMGEGDSYDGERAMERDVTAAGVKRSCVNALSKQTAENNILADHLDEEVLAWFEELRRKIKQQRRTFYDRNDKRTSMRQQRDEELVLLAQSGDEEHRNFCWININFELRAKSRAYFLIGADNKGYHSGEGMIGLYKAVRDYNEEKNASFLTALRRLCVNRQMITAIKAATRQKHQPLTPMFLSISPFMRRNPSRLHMDLLQSGAFAQSGGAPDWAGK